jgi:large subunit ribosomal protein L1
MGKKRVVIIGDISAEEEARKKKEEKRMQKAMREGEKTEKLKRKEKEEKKSAKIPGMKGGERVVDTGEKALEEMELQKQKEAELEKLRTEAAVKEGKTVAKVKKVERVRSAKYQRAKSKIDPNKYYAVSEAIKLIREINLSKANGTVEMHLNLAKAGQKFTTELPYSTGKVKRVAVADEATIGKIKEGKIDFDVLLASPEQMGKLVPLAKILGPKGLMPNPKNGTVVKDPKKAVESFQGNSLDIKSEKKAPLAHLVVGKLAMKDEELAANAEAVLKAVEAKNLKKAVVKTSMSPAVKLAVE